MKDIAAALQRRPGLVLVLLLLPPLAWLGVVYLGSLFALLVQSFFSIDDFSGVIDRHLTLHTYQQLFTVANLWVIARTVLMAALVTVACVLIAFPLALYIVRDASPRARAVFYLGVMLPLWSNYLVRVYAWKLILAKEGVITWTAGKLGLLGLLEAYLELPVLGGPSLSISYTGTFIVFVYIWVPYMILPVQTAIERVPRSMLEASADLGAHPWQAFRTVLWPLALPGVVAGSIFTFSLTLGDYIIPGIVGNSRPFIGMVVAELQGVAGNLPLAAAFCLVPIVAMGIYLTLAKRQGAFDAL